MTNEFKNVAVYRVTVYKNGNEVIKQFSKDAEYIADLINTLNNKLHCDVDNGYYIDISTFEVPEDFIDRYEYLAGQQSEKGLS